VVQCSVEGMRTSRLWVDTMAIALVCGLRYYYPGMIPTGEVRRRLGRFTAWVVVPPNMAHAFGAAPGHAADCLILIAPGLERFGYFRLLERLSKGEATLADLMASQELYDNHFLDSSVWRAARG